MPSFRQVLQDERGFLGFLKKVPGLIGKGVKGVVKAGVGAVTGGGEREVVVRVDTQPRQPETETTRPPAAAAGMPPWMMPALLVAVGLVVVVLLLRRS